MLTYGYSLFYVEFSMSKTISIEPITRIEGHMKVETHVEGGGKVAGGAQN